MLFLVFGLVVLAMLLILYGIECASVAAREGRVQPIRLRHTGETPELSLAKDQRFHIFLSRTPRPPPVDPHEATPEQSPLEPQMDHTPICFALLAATPTCAFSSSLRYTDVWSTGQDAAATM